MKVLVIDNYDSFVYNLVQYIGELGAETIVYRNDQVNLKQLAELKPDRIVISPGPGTPEDEQLFWRLHRNPANHESYNSNFRRLPRSSRNNQRVRRKNHPCKKAHAWKDLHHKT